MMAEILGREVTKSAFAIPHAAFLKVSQENTDSAKKSSDEVWKKVQGALCQH